MNALFCAFMDKEQESSFWTSCPEVQIKRRTTDVQQKWYSVGKITHI